MYYGNWSFFQHLPSSAIKSTFTNSHFSHWAVRDIIDQCIRVTGTSSKNTPHKKHLGKVFLIGKVYLKHFISHITNMFDMHTRVKKLFLAFFCIFNTFRTHKNIQKLKKMHICVVLHWFMTKSSKINQISENIFFPIFCENFIGRK